MSLAPERDTARHTSIDRPGALALPMALPAGNCPRGSFAAVLRLGAIYGPHSFEWGPDETLYSVAPASAGSGNKKTLLIARPGNWSDQHFTGLPFHSTAGITLPHGMVRSPEAAWTPRWRWGTPRDEQRGLCFPPLDPPASPGCARLETTRPPSGRQWKSLSPTKSASHGSSTPWTKPRKSSVPIVRATPRSPTIAEQRQRPPRLCFESLRYPV